MHGMYAGWHLTYDGIVDAEHAMRLNDLDFLREALLDLVGLVGAQVLDAPRLHKIEFDVAKLETEEDEGGVVGMVVLTTSHISIHTWPLRQRFSVDMFSCKRFDRESVERFLHDRLNVKRRASNWLTRNWP